MRIPPPLITRRLFAAAFAAALAGNAALPPAFAMQGAAEMDAEFYLKGLLGLPTAPAAKSVPLAPPRELNQAFVASTLRALEGAIAPALNATSGAALREAAAARRKALQLEYSRVLYNGAFGGGGYDALDESGSRSGGDTLQYGFDLTLLSYWTLLADARLPRATTSAVSQQLGDSLLEALAPPALRAPPPPQTSGRQSCSTGGRAPLRSWRARCSLRTSGSTARGLSSPMSTFWTARTRATQWSTAPISRCSRSPSGQQPPAPRELESH